MIKPRALNPGDTVALIAPADHPREPSEISQAKNWLERSGYRVSIGAHVFGEYGYLAGSDADRLSDIHTAFADDRVRAILCVRGKWGASRLLSQLDFDLIQRNPKVIVGCGDVTALLIAIWQRTGMVTFHGPLASRLGSSPETRESLLSVLSGKQGMLVVNQRLPGHTSDDDDAPWPSSPSLITYRPGLATGVLLGGSLSALIGLIATPFAFDPANKLLFLEETDQRFSQFDRDLTTLCLAGVTTRVNGLVIAECAGASARESPQTLSLEEIFAEQIARLSAPACYGLPIGQGRVQVTLPVGIQARLDAVTGTLELLEAGTTS